MFLFTSMTMKELALSCVTECWNLLLWSWRLANGSLGGVGKIFGPFFSEGFLLKYIICNSSVSLKQRMTNPHESHIMLWEGRPLHEMYPWPHWQEVVFWSWTKQIIHFRALTFFHTLNSLSFEGLDCLSLLSKTDYSMSKQHFITIH